MTFQIQVTSNAPGLSAAFADLIDKQLPFATSRALNELAKLSVARVRGEMPRRFRLHGTRLPKGINYQASHKRDWPDLKAIVGSKDEFLVPQEIGGTKRAKGGGDVAIPLRVVTAKRSASTGRIPKRLLPRNIPKSHKVPGEAIRGPLSARSSATGQKVKDARFWFLRGSVHIKPRFHFRETVASESARRYAAIFQDELAVAVKSARARAGSFSSEHARTLFWDARRKIFG